MSMSREIKECNILENFPKSYKLAALYEDAEWKSSPAMVSEVVMVAKKYLDGEYSKYDKISQVPKLLIKLLTEKNQAGLGAAKKGVGQTIILKFLGGNWKQWMIQEVKTNDCEKWIWRYQSSTGPEIVEPGRSCEAEYW